MLKSRRDYGARIESLFRDWFNFNYLHKCYLEKFTQEYGAFDQWLLGPAIGKPALIEIKTRPGINHDKWDQTKLDYYKVLSLRRLSGNHKAMVFVIFQDKTIVIDVNKDPDGSIFETVHNGEQSKLLALYDVSKLKTIPVGLNDLDLSIVKPEV